MSSDQELRVKQCMVHAAPHNWLVHRIMLPELARASRKYAKGRLVDIGCSIMPWKPLFEPYIDTYVGLDHEDSHHSLENVDIIADAYDTTLDDKSFDTALCTVVLEHLERNQRDVPHPEA